MKIKKAMLSLGLVLAAAGVATASAWVINDATASTQGAVDQGIILDWGEGSTLGDLTSLTYGSPVVQKVTVKKPQASEGVTGYAKVSFALTGDNISTIQVEAKIPSGLRPRTSRTRLSTLTPLPMTTTSTSPLSRTPGLPTGCATP